MNEPLLSSPHPEGAALNSVEIEFAMQRRARTLRWLEWALVIAVGFFEPVLTVLYALSAQKSIISSESSSSFAIGGAIARDTIALGVLGYVLFRQGRSWRQIGLGWQWSDLAGGVTLVLLSVAMQRLVLLVFYLLFPGQHALFDLKPANIPNFRLTLLPLLMMVVNPFYEELILRAFTQSEVTALTSKAWLAVLVSVGIEVSLHFYQGVFIAFSYLPLFATFAVYYQIRRRIWPVILCHMFFDVTALIALAHAAQHRS